MFIDQGMMMIMMIIDHSVIMMMITDHGLCGQGFIFPQRPQLDHLKVGMTDFKLLVTQQSEKGPNLKVVKWC